jgi:hypothetical protein
MKLAALETIHTLHTDQDSLHIYTHGSLTGKNRKAGAESYCKLFSFHLSFKRHATLFDGETVAMNTALVQVFGRTGSSEKAVIFSFSDIANSKI